MGASSITSILRRISESPHTNMRPSQPNKEEPELVLVPKHHPQPPSFPSTTRRSFHPAPPLVVLSTMPTAPVFRLKLPLMAAPRPTHHASVLTSESPLSRLLPKVFAMMRAMHRAFRRSLAGSVICVARPRQMEDQHNRTDRARRPKRAVKLRRLLFQGLPTMRVVVTGT